MIGLGRVIFRCNISVMFSNVFLDGSPTSTDTIFVNGGVCRMETMSAAACYRQSFISSSEISIVCGTILIRGVLLTRTNFGN